MVGTIQFLFREWYLNREVDRISRRHDEAIAAAKKRNADYDEIQGIGHEFFTEHQLVEHDLMLLHHRYLSKLASRRMIPLPPFDKESGNWEESPVTGQHYLSLEAMHELRGKLRQDSKERFEAWVPWVALIMGLIGTLTGLVAVLKQ